MANTLDFTFIPYTDKYTKQKYILICSDETDNYNSITLKPKQTLIGLPTVYAVDCIIEL